MARSSSFIFKDVVVQFDDGGFKIGAKSVLLIAKVEVLDLSIATYQFGNFFYAGDGSTTLLAVIGQELPVTSINVGRVACRMNTPTERSIHTLAYGSLFLLLQARNKVFSNEDRFYKRIDLLPEFNRRTSNV